MDEKEIHEETEQQNENGSSEQVENREPGNGKAEPVIPTDLPRVETPAVAPDVNDEDSLKDLRISRMSAHAHKKKPFINGLDLLILVVILAVAVCLATRFNPFGFLRGDGIETRVLEYTVLISDVDDTFSTNIKDGDRVFGPGSAQDMGIVSGTVIVDDFTQLVYVDGKAELAPYGNRVNLTVVIRVENASYESGVGYTVSGTRLAVGADLTLLFPEFSATGTVVNLNRVA